MDTPGKFFRVYLSYKRSFHSLIQQMSLKIACWWLINWQRGDSKCQILWGREEKKPSPSESHIRNLKNSFLNVNGKNLVLEYWHSNERSCSQNSNKTLRLESCPFFMSLYPSMKETISKLSWLSLLAVRARNEICVQNPSLKQRTHSSSVLNLMM